MSPETRHIVFLVIPQATLLDITGPYEVFVQALESLRFQTVSPKFNYQLHMVSGGECGNIQLDPAMIIHCDENIHTVDYTIDTLFVPGVPNSLIGHYHLSEELLEWIATQAKTIRRTCSVCTGSFFLAEAGLLNGKTATTHWAKCDALARSFPDVHVDSSPIFIREGNIYTSAGISAGMDLALALIEEDLGKSFALEIARQMVLYLKRPGSQSQFSSVLTYQNTDYQPVQQICHWIQEHLQEPLTIEALAEKTSMSPRNFARIFVRETGITPARYIDRLRVETACRHLVDSQLSLKEISAHCGLGSIDNMRKVFIKYMGISPADYRNNFSTTQ